MSDDQTLALAAEFPATDRQDWLRLVQSALKDRPYDKLVTRSYDGYAIEPLYERARGAPPIAGRAAAQPWQIVQRIDHPDPAAANGQALHDLENGATGLALVLAGAPAARGYGVVADTADALARTLDGIRLDAIPVRIETAPFAGRPVANLVTALVERQKLDPASLAVDFGLDPLGDMARTGRALLPWPELSARAGATAKELAANGFDSARFLRADGRAVHEAGGTEAQEIAFVSANAVAYLRLLESTGLTLDEARRRISFLMACGADQFITLAKYRAMRKVWARIEQASGMSPQPALIAAETAWRMMTARDPYVNILRATLAVTAAGLGGADAITVLPFTAALGLPDAFARRVARNLQLVLLEESNLYRVGDPAAGSGGIEALTTEIAQAAWRMVQEIEAAGGAAAALEKGVVQTHVAATGAARVGNIATRRDALTGTSDYPNLTERPIAVLDVPRNPAEDLPSAPAFPVFPSLRISEPYERLRDASDAILARTGTRPKVFLANLGKLSDFNARATFAKNFYEAGGIEAVSNEGFPDLDALVVAYKASGARLACLCSSDKTYAAEAERAASVLAAAGATVHLAGRPGEHADAWNKAGITAYIYVGCDVLAVLRAAHEMLVTP